MEKKTILIVEDDVIIGLQLKNMLVNLGYNVPEPVATGEEAIAVVTAERITLNEADFCLYDLLSDLELMFRSRADASGLVKAAPLTAESMASLPKCKEKHGSA